MKRSIAVLACLAALGLAGTSIARAAEWRVHGLLDLSLASGEDSRDLNRFTQGDNVFDPYRVHVFADVAISPSLAVYLETILHEGESGLRADGAYAQWTPWPQRDLHVQAGKIPWPIGTWGPRNYSDKNPLIGSPLMEQYHTSLAWNVPTLSIDQLVASAGQGQYNLMYGPDAAFGMTVVDDRYWDVGASVIGSARPFEYSLGTIQGTPGWPVTDADDTPGQSVLGRIGIMPAAGARFGVSGSWGTWLPAWFSWQLPAGASVRDYHEWLGMTDVQLERGSWELRGEGYLKGWQTIRTGDLRMGGGYAEGRLSLPAGTWAAARWETMRFSNVTTSTGVTRPWDDPIDRMEVGLGYRVSHDVRLKVAMQRNIEHPFGAERELGDLFALSASIKL